MSMKSNKMIANKFLVLGFSATTISHDKVHLRCGQCEALFVCGIATHERGCPNAQHECTGCNELIPVNQRYCADCV